MLIMTEREVIFLRSWFSKGISDQYLAIFFFRLSTNHCTILHHTLQKKKKFSKDLFM